jgi:hypothetical protein
MNRRRLIIIFLLLPVAALSEDLGMSPSIQEVKAKHEAHLMALPGVVSVGIGKDKDGNFVIMIGMDGPRPETEARLPHSLEGYPVLVRIIGPVKAQ